MKKVLKWIGIVLGGLIGLLVVFILAVVGIANYRLNKNYNVTVEPMTIPSGTESIERGRYLVNSRTPCIGCHGPDLAGSFLLDDPAIGQIYASNLTAGEGGIGTFYTDEGWVRAMRTGVGPDGKALMIMPSQHTRYLSNEDLGDMLAYIKSVPPVDKESPKPKMTFLAQALFGLGQFGKLPAEIIAEAGPAPQAPQPGITVEYGEYVARVAMCRDCHGEELNGGTVGGQPDGTRSPDLTQGGELLVWTEADFIKAFRTGETPSGRHMSADMPIDEYQMTDDDLAALFLYLKSLKAVQAAE